MKKIINGRVYDTDTAREMGIWGNNETGFGHITETLYRKRTGEFFLHGEGGPATKYAERVDQNMWSGGSRIIPIDYETARKWAEENLDADEYAEIFGMPDEGGEAVTLIAQVPADLAAKARAMAAEQKISIKELITKALEQITQK